MNRLFPNKIGGGGEDYSTPNFRSTLIESDYLLDRNYITYADEAELNYTFDGKYGPIPNSDGTVSLRDYHTRYISSDSSYSDFPDEYLEYLHAVFTSSNIKVTDMYDMLLDAWPLAYLDVSDWRTGDCTTMHGTFSGVFYYMNIDGIDVSKWDTSKVTDMSDMFLYCYKLTSLDISNWDTSKVTDMSRMFCECRVLTNITGVIDLTSIKNYDRMFAGANSLKSITIRLPSNISQSAFISNSKITNPDAITFVS